MSSDTEKGKVNPGFTLEEGDKWTDSPKGDKPDGEGKDKLAPLTPTMEYGPGEQRRMLKNLIVICFAFMLLFTAFQSMASLQNSINNVVSYSEK